MSDGADSAWAQLREGRFARLEAIPWWDQQLVERTRVLLVGAGALGNEVLKNLALLGVRQVVLVDRDRVEQSNLSRSILFRASDEGEAKAECAARAARDIFDGMHVHCVVGDVTAQVGLGYFRWADVVVGALDNREARLFVNAACAQVGRPWFDGGIEVLQGIVRGFRPPETACYECTMSEVDWKLVNQRRSCSLLARRAAADRGVPTTPTTASIIGAIQVQELVKYRHGAEVLLGRGLFFDGLTHASYLVGYPVKPDCPWHDPPARTDAAREWTSDLPLQAMWDQGVTRLGQLDALDLSREIVSRIQCQRCDSSDAVLLPAEQVDESRVRCPACGGERVPEFVHSLGPGSPWLSLTARQLGLPAWDIVWARRGMERVGLVLEGDIPPLLSPAVARKETNDEGQQGHG